MNPFTCSTRRQPPCFRTGLRRISHAFTLIELLVVISVIGVITAIALPMYNVMTRRADVANCTSNMRQITMATTLAAQDNDGRYPNMHGFSWEPGTTYIADLLNPYLGSYKHINPAKILHCPSALKNPKQTWLSDLQYPGYKYNVFYAQDKKPLAGAMNAMVFFDTTWADWTQDVFSHSPGQGAFLNVAYVDGHVAQMSYKDYIALNNSMDERQTDFFQNGWIK